MAHKQSKPGKPAFAMGNQDGGKKYHAWVGALEAPGIYIRAAGLSEAKFGNLPVEIL